MEEGKEEGKIRSIGISNQTPAIIKKFLPDMRFLPAVNQVELNPFYQQKELRNFMKDYGIIAEAWYPLGHGNRELLTNPVLTSIAEKYGKDAGQIILRWHIQEGVVALPKATTQEHINGNIDVFDFSLTDAEMSVIRSLDTGKGTHDPEDKAVEEGLKRFRIHD